MISKSLLGTTWKPITEMTAAERTVLRHSRSHYFATGKGQKELAKETKPRTIPTKAYTEGKGKVRVTGYEGDGRFAAVTNRDEKIVRSRDAYKFQKNAFGVNDPRVNKSFVNGVAKPISAMSRAEKNALKAKQFGHVKPAGRGQSNATDADRSVKNMVTDSIKVRRQAAKYGNPRTVKVKGGTVTESKAGFGEGPSWHPIETKGGQRRHKGHIITDPSPSPFNGLNPKHLKDYRNHEMAHASRRKPMSAFVRMVKKPETIWGDEARADHAMRPEARKMSGYRMVSDNPNSGVATMVRSRLGAIYQAGKPEGPKRYKEVTDRLERLESAKPSKTSSDKVVSIKSKKKDKKSPLVTPARAGIAAAATTGVGGGGYAAYKYKEKK